MKRIIIILAIFFGNTMTTYAQGMFSHFSGQDIGQPKLKGKSSFNPESQSFLLEGSGENMWFGNDQFWFEQTIIEGDFILSASVKFIGKGINDHRKAGIMIRSELSSDSRYIDGVVHGDGLTAMQYREEDKQDTKEVRSDVSGADFLQLERKGEQIIVRVSGSGSPLVKVAEKKMDLGNRVYAGLFICSHDPDVTEKVEFTNVRIEIPAEDSVSGYDNPSPSRLEFLDIETGNRKILYETEAHIEAPNWSRDGKYLIYNSGGKLYKFDLKERMPEPINTGEVKDNNNDHGISFNGKMLAISSSTKDGEKRHSIIYTLPVEGGDPNRITPNGPSYWHGWSPDGKWLTYCAERGGNYDVYRIPSVGGDEIRLTTAEGLDDGPEYSPDGNYIYFNSSRTGTMQIWRMKPDGTEQEQVTTDHYQDWFAHPSPDGKWLIMISYLPEVPAQSHPRNKRVMLRLMPAGGGPVKSVAFLYGGQGTINVPSWSPDSKKVAFVSYTY